MVWGEEALTNMIGFREHNRRLRDGPRRSYDVPLSDGRPGAVIPFQRGRTSREITQCQAYGPGPCIHRNGGLSPRWRRRYGSPRPDGLPMGRNHGQQYYPGNRSYDSPFRRQFMRRLPHFLDDEISDDGSEDYLNDTRNGFLSESELDEILDPLNSRDEDRGGRRMSYHRERERPGYHRNRSRGHDEYPPSYYNRRHNPYDDESMHGRSGRHRGRYDMYEPSEPETFLSY